MARTDPLVAHLLELLAPLGPARARAMFGGWGVYLDDRMMALIADDIVYLKTDAQTRGAFAAVGSEPFIYHKQGRAMPMSYWRAPEDALDSTDAIRPWALLAMQAAARMPLKKIAPRRRGSSAA